MRNASTILLLVILLGLLAAAGWYAYAGLPAAGEQLRSDYYIALGLGAIAAVTVGAGLMALLFYGSRPRLRRGSRFRKDR
jgi:hypothetical protein